MKDAICVRRRPTTTIWWIHVCLKITYHVTNNMEWPQVLNASSKVYVVPAKAKRYDESSQQKYAYMPTTFLHVAIVNGIK